MNKARLRSKYRSLRKELSHEQIEEQSLAIANLSLTLPIWDYTNYHLFLSISKLKEIDTSFLLHILQGRDKTILVSKSNFENASMEHYLLQENTKLVISPFGIPEPHNGITLPATTAEVVFVPLLAFDIHGNRLGYGKGFYDRFLAQCKPETIFVGLSFFEPEETIEVTKSDIPLHFAITPNKTYSFIKK